MVCSVLPSKIRYLRCTQSMSCVQCTNGANTGTYNVISSVVTCFAVPLHEPVQCTNGANTGTYNVISSVVTCFAVPLHEPVQCTNGANTGTYNVISSVVTCFAVPLHEPSRNEPNQNHNYGVQTPSKLTRQYQYLNRPRWSSG
jgi:hypothetical protein